MNDPLRNTAIILSCLATATATWAAGLYVAPTGEDSNPGTQAAPFKSLSAARDAARKFAGKEAVTIHVADGTFYLPETLVLTAADSGTAQAPVVYRATNEGKAILSGGLKLDLKWEPTRDGIWKAATPPGLAIDQVFINGERQRMARYPNFDSWKKTAAYQGFSADAFSPERAAKWADPKGGYIHAMHPARWGGYHYRITGKNPDGTVAYEGGWQNNRQMGMHKDQRMVENIFEELDAPREWFHDTKNNLLYFLPPAGVDLGTALVEVVRLRHLVELRGTKAEPVRNIFLEGFVFRHAARTFMDTKEPLLRSDWTIYRGGAVFLTGAEDVKVLDCEFDQVGGNAIFVSGYARRILVRGCHIHDTGASGVCFVGDASAVRDPLFEYNRTQDLTKIDRTPGPKTDDYPSDSAVEDCLIYGIGRVERQPAGVEISMAARIAVRDTSIYDCARSGINISEGTWGGHLIERVDVFDTVLETHDHGSFNSWGRDRYWTSKHRQVSEPEVKKDPMLPFLDAVEPTVIRDSRWRCDHGWDVDLDDGASNYEIYNNLMLNGGLKFREGYARKATNNVLVNSGFHPHVWFDQSGDEFTRNIVMKAVAPIGQPEGWGKNVDRNFFSSEEDLRKSRAAGSDANSISGDPMFIDPATGNFRVGDASPALQIGFKNFPMDQFGVKKPALKALAKTPVIPPLRHGRSAPPKAEEIRLYWLGAPLHSLEGEEFSAFGVRKEDGGVQLVKVPQGSAAARGGLQENDLVLGVNGQKVSRAADLFAALINAGSAPLKLRLVRSQQEQEITLSGTPFLQAEGAKRPEEFRSLVVPAPSKTEVTSEPDTSNHPPKILTDGGIAPHYGAVFPNGVQAGRFKMDLGAVKPVTAVSSWAYRQNKDRVRQMLTIYGSASPTDPGWEVSDASRFTPLGSIDTSSLADFPFTAASLRAPTGQSLGSFRWIVWQTAPISDSLENTSWQELGVETSPSSN